LSLASSAWLTVDTNYTLCTSAVITGSITANSSIVSWGGGVLGAMSNYGTSPGAVLVPGVNAFITNTPAFNLTQVASTALGAITTYGTSPGAVNVPSVNAYVTNLVGPGANSASLAPTGKTDTSAITVLSASGDGAQHEYMTGIQIGRTDAGTAAITAAVTDGTLTLTYVVPNNGGGGGNNVTFAKPFQWALNHAVTCASSGSVTTFYCYAQGFNAP
jgi:hypothetical protein